MSPVDSSAPRALSQPPVESSSSQPAQQPAVSQPSQPQQRPSIPGSRDEFVASPAKAPAARPDVSSLKQHTLLRQGGAGEGAEIKDLQNRLGVSQSGKFDAATEAAVRKYQTDKGLKVDGKVGQQTWGSLMGINGLKPGKEMLGTRSGGGGGSAPAPAPSTPAKPPSSNPTAPVDQKPPSQAAGGTVNATVDKITNKGARNQMTTGKITVNGHTYTYRSGGHGRGNLPNGDYTVTPHMWSRNTPGMVVDGVGFSFALSDKFDPRVGGTRTELRIHPDGGSAGTNGCMGIVGNGATQKQFREDMRAELARRGGKFTLHVG
ncbi:MAG TPA: peptidoglycan-binding domain-containing protein [Myxococcaceae bacterium]|nr:peptidoglycan-binding domain-containing protein [Myxococcaceae bacterium]